MRKSRELQEDVFWEALVVSSEMSENDSGVFCNIGIHVAVRGSVDNGSRG